MREGGAVMDKIQFRNVGEEWTAVYLNGELQTVGDSYLADEWLQVHYGVEVIDDKDQACMINERNAYETLTEVEERQAYITARKEEAQRKRDQAAALLEEAEILTKFS